LGTMKEEASEKVLRDWLERLLVAKVIPELRFDVLEASRLRLKEKTLTEGNMEFFASALTRYEANRNVTDHLAPWREMMAGGNAEAGRKVFFEKQEAGCLRCHKWNGEGGEVGPDLATLAGQKPRDYILESLVMPNRVIAAGYESVNLTLANGKTISGVVKGE